MKLFISECTSIEARKLYNLLKKQGITQHWTKTFLDPDSYVVEVTL